MKSAKRRQVFVIHGGDAYNSYDEYLESLKASELTLEDLRSSGWKSKLASQLGETFEVFNPRMPCPQNAKYAEWKIYFEKLVAFMEPGVILIGHSLGAIFLTKYLSEEVVPVSIAATLLVAAPYQTPADPYGDFILSSGFDRFATQGGSITFFQSKDDEIVPYAHFLQYQKALPQAQFVTLDGRGHFLGETFPELVQTIASLSLVV